MKKIILLLLFIPGFAFANMGVASRPSGQAGDIFIEAENSLRVVSEIIFYDIDPSSLNAAVKVNYKIRNEAPDRFSAVFFFIAENNRRSRVDGAGSEKFFVRVNGADVDFKHEVNKKLSGGITGNNNIYSGVSFTADIESGGTISVDVVYTQTRGYSHSEGGMTMAAASHYINLLGRPAGSLTTFSYNIFPIKSFGRGVDDITIKVRYPAKDKNGNKVDDFNTSIPLDLIEEKGGSVVLEKNFKQIPADYFDLSFNVIHYNKFGFTLTPMYMLSSPSYDNTWALALSADYIIKHSQISAGILWNFSDRMQLYQEMKFFPAEYVYYIKSCIDLRYSAGIVEQIRPEKNFGLRFGGGFRIFIPFEITWQMFPPLITEKWQHDLMFSIPLSF